MDFKEPKPFAEFEVNETFSNAVIRALTVDNYFAGTDRTKFAGEVRRAAVRYARSTQIASADKIRACVADLYAAAEARAIEEVVKQIKHLPPNVREALRMRAKRSQAAAGSDQKLWEWPTMEAFSDEATAKNACEALTRICAIGMRQTRKRRTDGVWLVPVPSIFAPPPSQAKPRREAEQEFAMLLQLAFSATSERTAPSRANISVSPLSPFIVLLAECLERLRIPISRSSASTSELKLKHQGVAAELIEQLHRDSLCPSWTHLTQILRNRFSDEFVESLTYAVRTGHCDIIPPDEWSEADCPHNSAQTRANCALVVCPRSQQACFLAPAWGCRQLEPLANDQAIEISAPGTTAIWEGTAPADQTRAAE